jgi:hypothetical protein
VAEDPWLNLARLSTLNADSTRIAPYSDALAGCGEVEGGRCGLKSAAGRGAATAH